MELPSKQNTPGGDVFYQYLVRLVQEVDTLKGQLLEARAVLNLTSPARNSSSTGLSERISIPAVNDPNATAQVYGAGINPSVPSITISGSGIGAAFGTSPTFVMTISSAATFRSAIGTDASITVTADTIPLAKITALGTDGSFTINATGRVTAYIKPT